ncbi:MAG: response regulator transcription factor [Clostridia bacterium]|nr:response regulator transcription factor [Clostridia bacterium]
MYNILICDDEADIVSALKIYLASPDLNFFTAENGREALRILEREEIHLIILDIMMPVMDGISTAVKIRETSNVPIIFLSAKSEDSDKILGLNIGADDYITKPFNPVEVSARVRSQLRRYFTLGGSSKTEDRITIGGLEIDNREKRFLLDGEEVALTPKEYDILKLLMSNPGKVFSPSEIYTMVWKESALTGDNTVAVHIRHLREKIEINPAEPRYLKVVWGQGYKIEKGAR